MIPVSKSIKSYKLVTLVVLVFFGIAAHQAGILEERFFLEMAEGHIAKWWFIPLLVIAKTSLYAFALPGSIMYVVIGLLYDPFPATLIIVAGGVSGAIAAYYLSGYLSGETRKRIHSSRTFSIIQKHSDFATLGAVRMLPGFPHSIINYGSGILQIPIGTVVVTAAAGFAAKGFLYSTAIHQAARAGTYDDNSGFGLIFPLIFLALLFLFGKVLHKNLSK